MTTLRALITAAGDEARPVWLDAERYATDRLGAPLARRIQWADERDDEWRVLGELAGDDQALTLRYCPNEEPGTAYLQVRVPCPEDPACPGPVWDIITNRRDLLLALDHGKADDPTCQIHHAEG